MSAKRKHRFPGYFCSDAGSCVAECWCISTSFLLGSAMNLIIISITKNKVIKISTIKNTDTSVSLISKVEAPIRNAEIIIAIITID